VAAGNIVPWTDPGGPPCCCDACSSEQVSDLGNSINNFVRIDLTQPQYDLLRSGSTLEYSMTITPSGNTPSNVPIASFFGSTLITTISFSVFNDVRSCRGGGSNNRPGLGDINCFPSAVNITGTDNLTWTYGLSYSFALILQAAGQGTTADSPLAQPAMYLYGIAGTLSRTFPNSGVTFTLANSGQSIGTVFGQSLKATKTTTGSIDGTITLSLDFSAP